MPFDGKVYFHNEEHLQIPAWWLAAVRVPNQLRLWLGLGWYAGFTAKTTLSTNGRVPRSSIRIGSWTKRCVSGLHYMLHTKCTKFLSLSRHPPPPLSEAWKTCWIVSPNYTRKRKLSCRIASFLSEKQDANTDYATVSWRKQSKPDRSYALNVCYEGDNIPNLQTCDLWKEESKKSGTVLYD